MVEVQKMSVLFCLLFLLSCDKNAELLNCENAENSFYEPSLETYLGDSINFFKIESSHELAFRLDDKLCRKDSCSYYIFNLSTFGVRNDSMMSLRYYSMVKKWNLNDVIVNCDFVQKFKTNDNKSSGYFAFFNKG